MERKSKVPRLDEMCGSEQSTQEDADGTNDDVSDAKEGITATHDCASTDQDGLCSFIEIDREICSERLSMRTRSSGQGTVYLQS